VLSKVSRARPHPAPVHRVDVLRGIVSDDLYDDLKMRSVQTTAR